MDLTTDLESGSPDFPIPENEQERLEKLHEYNILETPEDPTFDRLTRLASEYFDVPIALISLLDENRQWFKAYEGLDFRETDRSCAFCNYVLTDETVLVIEDTTNDPRVQDNPLVVDEPGLRFYAGAPLETDDGLILGTFCILDTQPGTLSDDDVEVLKLLAMEALSQIQLRYRQNEIEQKNEELLKTRKKLESSLESRETLMSELIHRTKNNFSLISSLFRIQKRKVDGSEAVSVLDRAQNRVQTMSLVHEKLHSLDGTDELNLKSYLYQLAEDLLRSLTAEDQFIEVSYDFDKVLVSSQQAVSLGLILNELITNAVQHAFGEDDGLLELQLSENGDSVRLVLVDDAGNLPGDFSIESSDSLGVQLVQTLAEDHLDGTVRIESDDRTSFFVDFPLK